MSGRGWDFKAKPRAVALIHVKQGPSKPVFACAAVISLTRKIERPFNIHAWRRGRRDETANGRGLIVIKKRGPKAPP